MNPEKDRLLKSSLFPLLFLLLIWIVFFYNQKYNLQLIQYGLKPLQTEGLLGIITMPLLHADIAHIISNSVPLLILGTSLFYFYREIAFKVFFISYIFCGALVWLFAFDNHPNEVHIGASGLVYALAGFLVASGIIRKHKALFGISLLIIFLYGTIIWGVLPSNFQKAIHFIDDTANVSWQGHLFGFIVGLALAFIYRKTGIQKPVYSWEVNNDDDIDDSNPYWLEDETKTSQPDNTNSSNPNPLNINYTYIPKKEEE